MKNSNIFPGPQRVWASGYSIRFGPRGNKRKNFKEREEMRKSIDKPMDPPLGKLFYFDTI